jgi:hypothetical protein
VTRESYLVTPSLVIIALQLRLREVKRQRLEQVGLPLMALWVTYLNAQGGKRPIPGAKPTPPLLEHERFHLLEEIALRMPFILPDRADGTPEAEAIPDLPAAAARGILDAIAKKLILSEALANLAPMYAQLKATAARG